MHRVMWLMSVCLLLCAPVAAWAEDVTVTTYYPSPRGVYEELRAGQFRDQDDPNFYLDPDTSSVLRTLNVEDLTLGGPPGNLRVKGSLSVGPTYLPNLPGNAVFEGKVGIGVAVNPNAQFHLVEDGLFYAFRVDDEPGDLSGFQINGDGNVHIGLHMSAYSDAKLTINQETVDPGPGLPDFSRLYIIGAAGGYFGINNVGNVGLDRNMDIHGGNPGPRLHIEHQGVGDILMIEDQASPDSSPFVVDEDGNVGIQVSAPVIPLAIKDIDSGLDSPANNQLTIKTGGISRMRFDQTGHIIVNDDGVDYTGYWAKLIVRAPIELQTNTANTAALYMKNTDVNCFWQIEHEGLAPMAGTLNFQNNCPPLGLGSRMTLSKDGNVWIRGDLDIGGVASAAVKAFVIPHPLKTGYQLVHSSLEGPEVGVYYRGVGQLSAGRATVALPDYFEALTRNDGRTVQVTPQFAADEPVSLLAASAVADSAFTVRAVDGRNPSQAFYWEVKAVRKDVEPLQVERPEKPEEASHAP